APPLAMIANGATLQFLNPAPADRIVFPPRQHHASAWKLREQAEIDVARDRGRLEEALDLAVLGNIGDAGLRRRGRHAVAHRLVVQQDLAAVEEVALEHAGDDLERFGAPRAD